MVRGEIPRRVLIPHETRFSAPPGHVRMYRVGHTYIWKVIESAVPLLSSAALGHTSIEHEHHLPKLTEMMRC